VIGGVSVLHYLGYDLADRFLSLEERSEQKVSEPRASPRLSAERSLSLHLLPALRHISHLHDLAPGDHRSPLLDDEALVFVLSRSIKTNPVGH
jgi:hypothetical protein